MALGRAEGGARLLNAESVSRTQEPVALRECGCEPGKALSVKRNEMKAPALSVQMSSVKWSICGRRGCRAANQFGFSGVIVLVNSGWPAIPLRLTNFLSGVRWLLSYAKQPVGLGKPGPSAL